MNTSLFQFFDFCPPEIVLSKRRCFDLKIEWEVPDPGGLWERTPMECECITTWLEVPAQVPLFVLPFDLLDEGERAILHVTIAIVITELPIEYGRCSDVGGGSHVYWSICS